MKTDIPEAITTPDRVETRIGTLEFFDGIPTKETSSRVYYYLDFSRAMETFLHGIPAASVEGLRSALLRSALSVRIRSCTLTS